MDGLKQWAPCVDIYVSSNRRKIPKDPQKTTNHIKQYFSMENQIFKIFNKRKPCWCHPAAVGILNLFIT